MPSRAPALRLGAVAGTLVLLAAVAACSSPPTAEIATDTDAVTHAENDRVPEGARWTQHYLPSSDGSDVELHADVLLPEDLEEGEEVPVILSVGSYFAHAGELADEGLDHAGPSDRFGDLVEGGDLFAEGYALVMVDLRGFGGSSGCLDFMGAGEQADVAAAIDWAADQPWSTGAVGMYGKSYDAITGLVGSNLGQDALQAVVAQSPMWDLNTSAWSNGVPRTPMVDSARSYNEIAMLPPMADDDERYATNAQYELEHPECTVANSAGYRTADPDSDFWATRDLAAQAEGTDTPLLFTQGLLDSTTPPEGMERFLANHDGPQRGWIGPWAHDRANEVDGDDRLLAGREGWFDEVMAFYDEHLKGEPATDQPAFVIQDSRGAWRAEDAWPVSDETVQLDLGGGSYVDDGAEGDPTVQTGNSFVQWSEPLAVDTRITGLPHVSFDTQGIGNVMVRLYDVAPDGTAVLVDEHVSTVTSGRVDIDLKSTDWTIPAGNHLAVEIGAIESGAFSTWIDSPSYQQVDVSGVRLDLTLDDPAQDDRLDGETATFLATYVEVSTSRMPVGTPSFALPTPTG